MKLNHANLCTSDVARAASFFQNHFGFAPLGEPRTNFAVLRGSDGFILNLMRPGKAAVSYPDGFHVGFFVATPAEVHAKHAELAEGGWNPGAVEDLTRGGFASTTFYCPLTDGALVEVSAPR
jgi:catechol 2,3-dioxygenase-like lactoylglutathione lyase family enzyme